jgi:ABC-type branched-subunit amino acid transport system ATPase component
MYKSYTIKNFRCFQDLTISPLERINLIAGKNNVGKTSLLEAIFIHSGVYKLELVLRVNAIRGIEKLEYRLGSSEDNPWETYFNEFDIKHDIVLSGKNDDHISRATRISVVSKPSELNKMIKEISLNSETGIKGVLSTSETPHALRLISKTEKGNVKGKPYYLILDKDGLNTWPIPPNPPVSTFFLGARTKTLKKELAERLGKVEIKGMMDDVLEALKIFDARLKSISTIYSADEPVIHGDLGMARLMPFPLMGGGMERVLDYLIHIMNAKDGRIIIDEIENGLHHSTLTNMWKAISKVARKNNTQIFATTHSLECIKAFHRAFSEGDVYDARLHRLDRTDEGIRAVTYSKETLNAAMETGLEVR